MLMQYTLFYTLFVIVLGILIINKDTTLLVLNNITFKWIFERKISDEVKKSETNLSIKELKSNSQNIHLSRFIGYSTLILGTCLLIVVGLAWAFAPFEYVKEVGTKVYMDSPNVGKNLLVLECFSTGLFIIVMVIISIKWSDEAFENKIVEKHSLK